MSGNGYVVDEAKGNASLVRPRYSPGLLLRDDDLKAGVDYTRELSRLLFRSLFGCGVICGLTVKPGPLDKCGNLPITVARGVALTGKGDPVELPQDRTFHVKWTCCADHATELWVTLCRTETCCLPRSTVCPCEDDDVPTVCTRVQEGFEIRVTPSSDAKCACGCPKPEGPKPATDCPDTGDTPPSEAAAIAPVQDSPDDDMTGCACADPCDPCYTDHYAGKCGCTCCGGDCVVLAVVRNEKDTDGKDDWIVDYRVRRFIRPVLVRDPAVWPLQCTPPEEQVEEPPEPEPTVALAKSALRSKKS